MIQVVRDKNTEFKSITADTMPGGKTGKQKGAKGRKGKRGKEETGDGGINDVDMFDQRY